MVCIVGCNHGIQRERHCLDTQETINQREHFRGLVEETITRQEVKCVGEEWGRCEMTIAHALADAHQIPWSNVNTTCEDCDKLCIPSDYLNPNKYTAAHRREWNALREQVMLRKISENCGAARNILVVCGFEHMKSIADLLRDSNFRVEEVNYREKPWYRAVFDGDPRPSGG